MIVLQLRYMMNGIECSGTVKTLKINKDFALFQILRAAAKNAKRPISSDLVTIKVEGKLEDGTKVDVYDSLSFVLGDGDVIQGGNFWIIK